MWLCRKCGKPVYFAERKQSLGFDWHPNCLRCEECGKRLNPGQHAEHKGVPYCHHPCYGALFGPQLFGHGTRNECHTSFGKVENRDGQVKRSHLESKLKAYNQYYEGKPGELKSREANGRMILEGVLRIYWGVRNVIHLKEEDDQRTLTVRRRSTVNSAAFYSDTDDEEPPLWRDETVNGWSTPQSPSTPVTPSSTGDRKCNVPFGFQVYDSYSLDRSDSNSSTSKISLDHSTPTKEDFEKLDEYASKADKNLEGETDMQVEDIEDQEMCAVGEISTSKSSEAVAAEYPFGSTTVDTAASGNVEKVENPTNQSSECQDLTLDTSIVSIASSANNESVFVKESDNSLIFENSDLSNNNNSLEDPSQSRKTAAKTGSTAIRRRPGRRMNKAKVKRRCSINGHFYLRETSSFTPPHGSPCSVWVTSLVTVEEVLNMLLEKYKVEMSSRNFALFVIKDNG
ncbi:Ras association domain-containing protein 2, partial [Halocaridina rubra]